MKKIGFAFLALTFTMMSGRCRFHSSAFGGRDGNYIVMRNGDVHEEIKYDGQIKINEDETAIDYISPNGYLMFIRNDEKLIIESNYHGQLVYEFNDEGKKSMLDENGRRVLAGLISEMMSFGFDAEARVERIYKRGGNAALLREIDHLKNDNTKEIYFERILSTDSISDHELTMMIKKISTQLGSDYEKEKLLNRFTDKNLRYPETAEAYLDAIESLGSDYSKENLLTQLINRHTISEINFDRFMRVVDHLGSDNAKENLIRLLVEKQAISADGYDKLFDTIAHFGSDNAKANLLQEIINKKEIASAQFESILRIVKMFGSDNDKSILYRKLAGVENLTEDQWIALIDGTVQLGSDNEKANLLIEIGEKMPGTENLKSAYLKAAKTLGSDNEFGRVMKAIK